MTRRVAFPAFLVALLVIGTSVLTGDRASVFLEPVALAGGGGTIGNDTDLDSLPDDLERIFRTDPRRDDTDGDGYTDGVEWVHRSDPLDPTDVPHLGFTMRSFAYEVANGAIRVVTLLWPSNPKLVEKYQVYVGSPHLNGPEGNSTLGLMNVTPIIPQFVSQVSFNTGNGMKLMSLSWDIDARLFDKLHPFSVGIAARVSGVALLERMSFFEEGASKLVFFPDPSQVPGTGPAPYWFLPLDPAVIAQGGGSPAGPGGGSGDPQYCETQLDAGTPTGAGGITYQVLSAKCTPQGFLYCVAADCLGLKGQSLTLIDYGFLQTKAHQ